ncbi:MAG: sulfur reduction protein DsrE, partial [Desulfobacteraceae bacterium]|nr:sulfur reduction protein DsrE [Desulfobacteraceae bacterium]
DYDVSMFLTDDAVMVVKHNMINNIVAPTGDEAGDHYQFLLEKKVPIFV